jgi:uroporphyrinogen-III synthase
MKNILITRSKSRSKKLKEHLESLGYKVFIEPLFSIKKNFSAKDLLQRRTQEIANVLISSANAIYILKKLNIAKETPIYAVGASTANKIKKLGYKNIFYPKKSAGLELYKIIINNLKPQTMYYFHGEKISFDFKTKLQKKGFKIENFEVYQTREIKNLSKEFRKFSVNNKFEEILIFSQNSLEIFNKICKKYNLLEYFNYSNIICLSSKIASNAQKIGFKKTQIFHKNPVLNKFYDTR